MTGRNRVQVSFPSLSSQLSIRFDMKHDLNTSEAYQD